MIDTICLLIEKNKFIFKKGDKWDLLSETSNYEKYVRNPNKQEKESGKYFPRLTGYKRGFYSAENIKIEFSIPKLLYLNNLNEVSDSDFDFIIKTLQNRLEEMGIRILKLFLINASVSSVHYSKNINLENYTSNYIISEINKINVRKNLDFAKTRFINEGQSLYLHSNSYELVIYDKIADLNKDKKRSIDKNQTEYQRDLFEYLNKNVNEILRFEVRLNKKNKMKKVLKDLGFSFDSPTFEDVFNSEISKKVVNYYWGIIKDNSFGLFNLPIKDDDEILRDIFKDDIKSKQAIYLYGLYKISKNTKGIRCLRSIVDNKSSPKSWYRITKDIKNINENIIKTDTRDWVKYIDRELEKYESYKLGINQNNIKI